MFIDKIQFKNETILISKNQKINEIIETNFVNTNLIKKIFYVNLLKFSNNYINYIHYGEFKIEKNITFNNFRKIISSPSNYLTKFTIVEGWQKYQLHNLLDKYYNNYNTLDYLEAIADTYLINLSSNNNSLNDLIKEQKKGLQIKYKNHKLLKKFTFDEIIIIASLVEKEGIDDMDKKKISSVIFNRIEKKMKLQIDATVIFAITNGEYKFDRKLTKKDLKIKNKYNTYFIEYLPPAPICYVGTKTIELIFENYKSNYFYYFYDENKQKHVYSENYNDHLKKLNEYRKKIK